MVYLRGKSYYTAGLYPFYIAAGAVFLEEIFRKPAWRTAVIILVILLNLPLVPGGIPLGKKQFISEYFKGMYEVTGVDAMLRWEDGQVHSLPQDYADRLGWDVLGDIVRTVTDTASGEVIVYCENYGQAGAVEFYAASGNLRVQSFSDSYLLWALESFPEEAVFLYINDRPGDDVISLFGKVELLRGINDGYAREYGTNVYLLEHPKPEFFTFWTENVRRLRKEVNPD